MNDIVYILKFIFAVCSVFLAGRSLLSIIDSRRVYSSFMERCALYWPLGLGVIALAQLGVIFLRRPLTRGVVFLLVTPFWIQYFVQVIRRIAPMDFQNWKELFIRPRIFSPRMSLAEFACICLIVFLCAVMIAMCLLVPKYTWDSRSSWGLTSKILFYRQTIFTSDFMDPYRFHPSPLYPLLVPLSENFVYNILGVLDEYLVKIIYGLLYLSLVVVTYVTQRRYFRFSRLTALIGTVLSVSVPCLFVIYCGSVPSAFGDFPLGCLFTFSTVYAIQYMRRRRREDIIIAGAFICLCLFTKNEGIPLFMILTAVLLFDAVKGGYVRSKDSASALFFFCCLPFIILLPWFAVKSHLAVPVIYKSVWGQLVSHFSVGLTNLFTILRLTAREMFTNMRSWGLTWYLSLIALCLFMQQRYDGVEKRRIAYLFVIPFVYYFFVITPVYMTFPFVSKNPVDIEFEGTSFERLRLHALPVLMLFIGITFGRLFEERTR